MKRTILYLAILLAALTVPRERYDVGKLKPVEVVLLFKERNAVVMSTDTGDMGIGRTVSEAYENLKETSAGIIFLDTADYLLVEESAADEVVMLHQWLKPSVRMCFAQRGTDLKAAAEYLSTHPPATELKEYGASQSMEKLTLRNGRMFLQKMEKSQKTT